MKSYPTSASSTPVWSARAARMGPMEERARPRKAKLRAYRMVPGVLGDRRQPVTRLEISSRLTIVGFRERKEGGGRRRSNGGRRRGKPDAFG